MTTESHSENLRRSLIAARLAQDLHLAASEWFQEPMGTWEEVPSHTRRVLQQRIGELMQLFQRERAR